MSEALKVGDLIATTSFGRGVDLHKIIKITPTMYVCDYYRFRRDDMRVIGRPSGYQAPYQGRVPTAGDLMIIRMRKANAALAKFIINPSNVALVESFLAETNKVTAP